MKVFVIIVTYNPINWVEKCFESLVNSSIPLHIIVVDNGSTDGGPDLIKNRYFQVEFIQSNENLGFGKANNIGIEKAYKQGADYVFLLNQDAWVDTDTIEKLVETSIIHPEFGILSPMHMNGKGSKLDFGFQRAISKIDLNYRNDDFVSPIEVPFVNAAIWLISRKCIEVVGGFSPSFFHYSEDDNYIQRLNYHRLKIGILPNIKGYHDRESRGENIFLNVDLKRVYERDIIMTLSNPIINITYFKILISNLLNISRNFLFNKKELTKNKIYIIALFKINRKKIYINREISKSQPNAFLNI
jgi:N-acetylglucosaminyl-diphospho-decaprenol L-rhamnosyltransferase